MLFSTTFWLTAKEKIFLVKNAQEPHSGAHENYGVMGSNPVWPDGQSLMFRI
jgi:hypothetical protein